MKTYDRFILVLMFFYLISRLGESGDIPVGILIGCGAWVSWSIGNDFFSDSKPGKDA